MKVKRLAVVVFVSCALSCTALSSVFAQGSDAGAGVIAPPTGGGETIAIPQTGNVEVLPVPPPTSGTPQTTAGSGQQLLAPLPGPGTTPPTTEEQPLTPVPEQTLPGIAPENVSGTAQTSPTLEPLSPSLTPLELQPAAGSGTQPSAELPVAPLAPMTGETALPAPAGQQETQPAALTGEPIPPAGQVQIPAPAAAPQPSAELPAAPPAPMTGETAVPALAGQQETQPAALTAEPITPAGQVQISVPAAAAQPQPEQFQPLSGAPVSPAPAVSPAAPLPAQNIPAPAAQAAPAPPVSRPPHIVPGEVLRGMPAYVNVQTTHIVQPGEDLHWIAAIYYGNAQLWKKIYTANKSVIKDPNHLKVGTKLIIPPR